MELVIFHAGDHCLARMSKQISPVLKWMFGCHIGVLNVIVGGREGYEGGIRRESSKWPSKGMEGEAMH